MSFSSRPISLKTRLYVAATGKPVTQGDWLKAQHGPFKQTISRIEELVRDVAILVPSGTNVYDRRSVEYIADSETNLRLMQLLNQLPQTLRPIMLSISKARDVQAMVALSFAMSLFPALPIPAIRQYQLELSPTGDAALARLRLVRIRATMEHRNSRRTTHS